MTAATRIAKLEALLARVLVRADEPRGGEAGGPATARAGVEEEVDEPTVPPPPLVQAAIGDVEIEVAEVAVVDVSDGPDLVVGEATAPDDALLDEISGSRERLVVAERDDTSRGLEADEAEEPAPASSRRPVAPPPEERLAEIAFGADEPPPVRTPPPKSGPLPAPPPEHDADVTGVRSSVPAPGDEAPRPAPARELEPEVARLRQVAEAREPIADVIGEAQRFAPATFVALLDASLEL